MMVWRCAICDRGHARQPRCNHFSRRTHIILALDDYGQVYRARLGTWLHLLLLLPCDRSGTASSMYNHHHSTCHPPCMDPLHAANNPWIRPVCISRLKCACLSVDRYVPFLRQDPFPRPSPLAPTPLSLHCCKTSWHAESNHSWMDINLHWMVPALNCLSMCSPYFRFSSTLGCFLSFSFSLLSVFILSLPL